MKTLKLSVVLISLIAWLAGVIRKGWYKKAKRKWVDKNVTRYMLRDASAYLRRESDGSGCMENPFRVFEYVFEETFADGFWIAWKYEILHKNDSSYFIFETKEDKKQKLAELGITSR
jgi:hypothetical protein